MKARNFDKEASSWDDSLLRTGLARDVARAISTQVSLKGDMDVLDFGCGTGLLSFNIRPSVRSIVGVDTSKGMLDVFLTKARQQNVTRMKAYHMDLGFGDRLPGEYHVVMSSMTLHHVKDTRMLLEHFHAALVPGGRIALADLDEEGGLFHDSNDGVFHSGFNRGALGRLLESVGFKDVAFADGAQIKKSDTNGQERVFGVFLVTARK